MFCSMTTPRYYKYISPILVYCVLLYHIPIYITVAFIVCVSIPLQEGEQDPLLQGLYKVMDTLNSTTDLLHLDVMVFLRPFCEIIQSDDTTGPITGMAIASLDKFLAYGLIGKEGGREGGGSE